MKNNNGNGYSKWLKDNLWNLIITFASIIFAYAAMQTRMSIIEAKSEVMEKKLAEYPSQEYFDLKFKIIESQLEEVKLDVKQHLGDSRR